jgi:GNAT superfamily N-acetyltransferase
MAAMELKTATTGDEGLLASIEQAANEDALAHVFTPPYPWSAVRERWTAVLADPEVRSFVVVVDGVGVGYLAHDARTLRHLGVVARHRGTGVADDVLAAVPPTVDRLWVLEQNTRARRFYERHGWRPDGRTQPCEFEPYPTEVGYTR